jgi:hypothetical protein
LNNHDRVVDTLAKTRKANVNSPTKEILLANHYKFVMLAHSSKEVRAAASSCGCMKWMKWIGRSLVERAAATALARPA